MHRGKGVALLVLGTLFLCVSLNVKAEEVLEGGLLSENPVESYETYQELEALPSPASVADEGVYSCYAQSALPNQYDPREKGILPVVRDQGSYSICWSFVTMAGCEINSILQNLGTTSVDYSEHHTVYFSYHMQDDPLQGITGDGATVDGSYLSLGNCSIAYHTLLNWKGAVAEEAAPFEEIGQELDAGEEKVFGSDRIHLQNVRCYSTSTDSEWMKREVLSAGSVQITYNMSLGNYNSVTHSQYSPNSISTNHAVTIVGWDDNYSREKFLKTPEGDGAWLVRNSYGNSFGEGGYFWLSYYDKTIGPNAYALYVEAADNYDHNYQYDGTVFDSTLQFSSENVKAANVFTAKGNPEGSESLEAVGFYTSMAGVDYEVQIYKNPEKDNPESGTAMLQAPVIGKTQAVGYYTIPLGESLSLKEGDQFAIVISFTRIGSTISLPVEGVRKVSIINSVASAQEGQSFLYGEEGWYDWGAAENKNIRIKAYTNNIERIETDDENSEAEDGKTESGDENSKSDDGGSEVDNGEVDENTSVTEDFPFVDIAPLEDSWKYVSAKRVYGMGIMTGTGNYRFRPNEGLTRGMFATVLYRMAGQPPVETDSPFLDVAIGEAWYCEAVLWCYEQGIVRGYGDGTFRPMEVITREELAQMLWNYDSMFACLELSGEDGNSNETCTGGVDAFSDGEQVSSWATEAMEWCVSQSLITGRRTEEGLLLAPKGQTSRIECAAVIRRYLDR